MTDLADFAARFCKMNCPVHTTEQGWPHDPDCEMLQAAVRTKAMDALIAGDADLYDTAGGAMTPEHDRPLQRRTPPMTLSDRIAAGGDERGLIEELWAKVHGPMPRIRTSYQSDGSKWPGDGYGPITAEYRAWTGHRNRFQAMLDAGAYLDAVMLLVPEGWRVSLDIYASKKTEAILFHDKDFKSVGTLTAPTPALALAAALAKMEEQNG